MDVWIGGHILKLVTKLGIAETPENAKDVVIQEKAYDPSEEQKSKIKFI